MATPTDYAKFLIEVINPKGSDEFRLTQATLTEMGRPTVKVPDDPRGSSWALGWQVFDLGDRQVIAHGGDNPGFHSFAAASIEDRSAFVLMTNGESGWKTRETLTAATEALDRLLRS